MENIIEHFAEKLGVATNVAKQGISITSRYFLQNSEPAVATGLLSMLPSSLTNMFSVDEKNEIKTSKENIPPEVVIEKYLMYAVMVINKKEKMYTKKQ